MSDAEHPKRYRGQRGPNRVKKESMVLRTIRLPQKLVDFYEGSTPEMRRILTAWMEGKLVSREDTTDT
jgi:hypothetical protein